MIYQEAKKWQKNHETHTHTQRLGFELWLYSFQEETVLLLCSFDLASLACMSLSKIGGSNGITSRHLSEAATITCLYTQAGFRHRSLIQQTPKYLNSWFGVITSSSKKSIAASSSTVSFKGAFKKWMSSWICWNPLRLNVWSRTYSCKLFRQSLTTVVTTDSCKIRR